MRKFVIFAALESEVLGGKSINQCDSMLQFVFSSEMLEHATKHGNVITFDCNGFVVDEKASSSNWRDAFNFNEEPPRGIVITVDVAYGSGIVLPYVG